MNEIDLEQIEKLLTRKLNEQSLRFDEKLSSKLDEVSAAFDEKLSSKLDEVSAAFDKKLSSKLDEVSAAFDKKLAAVSASVDTKLDAVSEMFSKELATGIAESERRLENLIGVLEKKVDMVIETQQALVERVDRMELGQREFNHSLDRRISNLAADLATHKADPAAHKRGYSVKEDEEAFKYPETETEV